MNDSANPNAAFLEQARQLDQIADRFESQFLQVDSFRIEEFLGQIDTAQRGMILPELIVLEVELRTRRGESLDPYEYHSRFPNSTAAIEQAFARLSEQDQLVCTRIPSEALDASAHLDIRSWQEVPKQLGPYAIHERIGAGSFGVVFRAVDSRSGNVVALKFPRGRAIASSDQLIQFLKETENATRLKHPHIVRSYGAEHRDGFIFIVQQFIEGRSFKSWLEDGRDSRTGVEIIARIAEAAGHAHQRGFIHRDIKPANILIDASGVPYLTDFGLALHFDQQPEARGQKSGSPVYMSPEQVLGLAHRLDGRSDIWSLGVILYQLLTGRRPFNGRTREELFEEIKYRDAWPPRMLCPEVDTTLQSICMRCLCKAPRKRFLSADELAGELRHWLQFPGKISTPLTPIIPKGLRSYGPNDAEFFLRLLPGPRDRDDLPEAVRFWKTRIESRDPQLTFSTGVIFGPSGSGKSSLVKAGLLPQLAAAAVTYVYVEATANDTEVRLLKGLRHTYEEISHEVSLPEVFANLRAKKWGTAGKKVLVVLDQFEQWLSAADVQEPSQLTDALRQCDGENLQCLILVRDDFWLATSRFMQALDIDLREGENVFRVDRFDRQHARQILAEFGKAYRRLPVDLTTLTEDQNAFLDQAIDELAEEGRVICVRLAIFVEMFKSRPWTRRELARVGGVHGIGEKFLEETFGSPDAPPQYRMHERAARAVLEHLLPPSGLHIRGAMRSCDELLQVSTYADHPERFDGLIRLLDHDLRLITPADPNVTEFDSTSKSIADGAKSPGEYYQLTHDFLVSAVRTWVTREKRRTWRGRAEMRLHELEEQWSQKHETRFLPGPLELAQINVAIPKIRRTELASAMLRQATIRYLAVCGAVAIALVSISALAATIGYQRQAKNLAFEHLLSSGPSQMPNSLSRLRPYRDSLEERMRPILKSDNESHRFRAACAICEFSSAPDLQAFQTISDLLARLDKSEFNSALRAFSHAPEAAHTVLEHEFESAASNLHATRIATLDLGLGSDSILRKIASDWSYPDQVTEFMLSFGNWYGGGIDFPKLFESDLPADAVFAIVVALGNASPTGLTQSDVKACTSIFEDLHRSHPDSGIHSASGWAMQKWGIDCPQLPVSSTPPVDRDWWVMPLGAKTVELVRVRPGEFIRGEGGDAGMVFRWYPVENVRIADEYWITAREVSFELLDEWLATENGRKTGLALNREPDLPAKLPCAGISFLEAAQFANWMSDRHLAAADDKETVCGACYEPIGDDLVLPRGRFGIRLPTPDEWEYACRAGSRTRFVWGNNSSLATCRAFAVNDEIASSQEPVICGTRIPNRWGVFDAIGNVSELTRDYQDQEAGGMRCFMRGGNCRISILMLVTAHLMDNAPHDKMTYQGMRLIVQFPPAQ